MGASPSSLIFMRRIWALVARLADAERQDWQTGSSTSATLGLWQLELHARPADELRGLRFSLAQVQEPDRDIYDADGPARAINPTLDYVVAGSQAR